jgi:hypothetical protein
MPQPWVGKQQVVRKPALTGALYVVVGNPVIVGDIYCSRGMLIGEGGVQIPEGFVPQISDLAPLNEAARINLENEIEAQREASLSMRPYWATAGIGNVPGLGVLEGFTPLRPIPVAAAPLTLEERLSLLEKRIALLEAIVEGRR